MPRQPTEKEKQDKILEKIVEDAIHKLKKGVSVRGRATFFSGNDEYGGYASVTLSVYNNPHSPISQTHILREGKHYEGDNIRGGEEKFLYDCLTSKEDCPNDVIVEVSTLGEGKLGIDFYRKIFQKDEESSVMRDIGYTNR